MCSRVAARQRFFVLKSQQELKRMKVDIPSRLSTVISSTCGNNCTPQIPGGFRFSGSRINSGRRSKQRELKRILRYKKWHVSDAELNEMIRQYHQKYLTQKIAARAVQDDLDNRRRELIASQDSNEKIDSGTVRLHKLHI